MIDWDLSPADIPRAPAASAGHRPPPAGPASRNDSAAGHLRAIPYQAFAVTPLPETWESDTEFAWLEFDAAIASMDMANQPTRSELPKSAAASGQAFRGDGR